MKNTILIFGIFLITSNAVSQVVFADQPNSLTVTNPAYDSKENPDLRILAVELSNKYTAVTFYYINTSGEERKLFLVRSGPEALYISTNRRNYSLLNQENIGVENEPTIVRPGGSFRFKAYFEPLPRNTKIFNLIEASDGKNFSFIGVNMEPAHLNVEVSSFTQEYNTFNRYDSFRQIWGRPITVNSTWKFNAKARGNIMYIDPNGNIHYYRMKNVRKAESEGNPYQRIYVVDDRNQPFILDLYDTPTMGLIFRNEYEVPIAQSTKR